MLTLALKSVIAACTFVQNVGEEIAGAIAAIDRTADAGESIVEISNSTFDGNSLAPNDPLQLSYTDIFAQNTYQFSLANITFRNISWDPTVPFSSSVGCVAGQINLIPSVAQSEGVNVTLPPFFAGAGGRFDVSRVTATFDGLTLWYRVGQAGIDDARSELLLGNFTASVTTQFVVNNGSVSCGTSCELRLRGRTEIVTKGPNLFSNVAIRNYGTVRQYESESRLQGAILSNEPGATWRLINFSPEVSLISVVNASSRSVFKNSGDFYLSTGLLDGVSFTQTASGTTSHILSNYWSPNNLKVQNNAATNLTGTFFLDSSQLGQFSEPAPFQEFMFLQSPSANRTGTFSSYLARGGYSYTTRIQNAAGVDSFYARVTGFFPRRAVYSNTGTTITVTFPRPTNTPGLSSACSTLLQAATIALLDAPTARCVWRSPSELLITSSKLPAIGATLSFVPGVVVDAVNPSFNMTEVFSVAVSAPDAPVAPTAVIVSQTQLAQCDSMTLDGSASYGGGSVSLQFRWELVGGDSGDTAVRSLLQSTTNATVTIDQALFPSISSPKDYVFQLSVTSFFGLSSAATAVRVTRYADSRPRVFIEGFGTRLHPTSEPLKLQGRVLFASCTPTAQQTGVAIRWTQTAGPSPRIAASTPLVNSSTLFFVAGSFDPSFTYTFSFSATFQGLTATDQVNVTAVGAPLSLISSGDGGFIPANANATLRVSLADPSAGTSPVTYTWLAIRCPIRGQQNTNTGGGSGDDEIAYSAREIGPGALYDSRSLRELLLTRPTGVICPDKFNNTIEFFPAVNSSSPWQIGVNASRLFEGDYLIAVVAAKDVRIAQALISFSVASPSAYARTTAVGLRPKFIQGSKILPAQRLAIEGLINNRTNVIPSGIKTLYVERDLANATIASSARSRTFFGSLNQVLEAGSLDPGRFYFLELQAISTSTQLPVGSNRIVLAVNAAPTGGSLSVEPRTGGFQFQEYTFSAPNWNDDTDQPLRYVFSVSTDMNATNTAAEIILSDGLEVPTVRALLPISGLSSESGRVRVTLRVFDALGAETAISTTVEALESTLSIDAQYSRLQQNLLLGDVSSSIPLVTSLLVALNKNGSADPNRIRDQLSTLLATYAASQPLTEANLRILFGGVRLLVAVPSQVTSTVRDNVVLILQTTLPVGNFSESAQRSLIAVESSSSQRTVSALLFAIRDLIVACAPTSTSPVRLTFDQALTLFEIARRLSALQGQTALLGENTSSVTIGLIEINSVLTELGQLAGGLRFATGSDGTLLVVQTNADGSTSTVSTILWQGGTFPFTKTDNNGTVVGPTVVTVTIVSSAANNYSLTSNFTVAVPPPGAGSVPVGCGVFDPATQIWVSNGCNLQTNQDSAGQTYYTCTCNNVLSTSSASGPSGTNPTGTRSLTLLFNLLDAPSSSGGPGTGAGTPSDSNAVDFSNRTAAIIAGSVVAAVVVIAIIVGLLLWKFVFLKRRAQRNVQMERLRASQSRARGERSGAASPRDSAPTSPRESAPPPAAGGGAVAGAAPVVAAPAAASKADEAEDDTSRGSASDSASGSKSASGSGSASEASGSDSDSEESS